MLYYKPADGWAGDPVPFFWQGKFHLFYVKEIYRPPLLGWRHFWGHVVSEDLLHWEEYPDAIPIGQVGEVDSASCGTGSVFYDGELFHIYYLGRYFNSRAEIRETLCHATSPDLINWEKDPANPIFEPDPEYLKPEACRDPFPYWNEDKGHYSMVFTAQLPDRPHRKSGCLASVSSTDLKNWEYEGIFYAPNSWDCLECPDLFKWGDWWYLIYSSAGVTCYRRARSQQGPWEVPPVDKLDGNQFYAAKTAFDGQRRILFGWVPTREGDQDEGRRQWGGHMAIREIVRDEAGYLWCKSPKERNQLGDKINEFYIKDYWGKWDLNGDTISGKSQEGFSYASIKDIPGDFTLDTKFKPDGNVHAFGVMIRANQDLSEGYLFRIEPRRRSLFVYRVNQGLNYPIHQRYYPLAGDEQCPLKVIVKGSIIDLYIAEKITAVFRAYDFKQGELVFFIEDGQGEFRNLDLRKL